LKFLLPYGLMLQAMAYSLQQALEEGLGVNPTHFEPIRSGVGPISGSQLDVQASVELPALAWVGLGHDLAGTGNSRAERTPRITLSYRR
jgi:hypothetical protein